MNKPRAHQKLSIVVPAYNEAGNIEAVVRESVETLSSITDDYEIVVVEDCGSDNTWEILEKLASEIPQLKIIKNPHNLGCHPSSLVGFKAATGDWRYFIPGDNQIPAAELPKFLEKADEGCDVVYSWRVKRADPPHRLWISGFYNILIRLFFGIRVHDVDSSSMLSRRAVEELLPDVTAESAFISVEILIAAERHGLKIGEAQIHHRPRLAGVATGINMKDLLKVPKGFFSMLVWMVGQKLK